MTQYKTSVAVIGAGHAGIEAALASARMGIDTVLFTMNLDAVGNMPCNPSIGGTAKGHLVFEIDALGGEMGYAADRVTMQSRTLNLGKGAAVHSKRVQADRALYKTLMKQTVEKQENLRLIQAEIVRIGVTEKDGKTAVSYVETSLGDRYETEKAVIASGTYLESAVFVGDKTFSSGPDGMLPSKGLSASLSELGIELLRFKTGTPARISKRSIDFTKTEIQAGETPVTPFSSRTDEAELNGREQTPCHMIYTSPETLKIIKDNLGRSAMYSGNIVGTGPRYCPSIETKVVRFADKERHQLFIEPCGASTGEMYLQGFSTSMPTDVQQDMVHSLPGFENAEIMRYAYAIEYDCAEPTQMFPTLEFKKVSGLYGAGQFNGTSGYEEAAAQGLVAGINAALAVKGEEPMILPRSSSYIGTLIDDLVTKGTNEPYRIMTSRSEYRLLLRQDNADLRLSDIGRRVGLLPEDRYLAFCEKRKAIEAETARLHDVIVAPSEEVNQLLESLNSAPISTGIRLSELIRRPELGYDVLSPLDKDRPALPRAVRVTAEIGIKYEGYIRREEEEVARRKKLEDKLLPAGIDYRSIPGLRLESIEKLEKIRPLNIGQASRISGVNPADVSVLLIYLDSQKRRKAAESK